jgi:hypothetical protein
MAIGTYLYISIYLLRSLIAALFPRLIMKASISKLSSHGSNIFLRLFPRGPSPQAPDKRTKRSPASSPGSLFVELLPARDFRQREFISTEPFIFLLEVISNLVHERNLPEQPNYRAQVGLVQY